MTAILEDIACPMGCLRNDRPLFTARDRLHGLPGTFPVVRCCECGLIRTTPRPTASSIGFYYPSNYSPYATSKPQTEPARRGWLSRSVRWLVRNCVRMNTESVPRLPPGRLLEIGCASGSFMTHMAKLGWSVEGIEFSDEAAGNARALGLQVRTGTIEAAPDPAAPYDLVVGWMVVEHLHDVRSALCKLARWTRPGGWLAISTPNAGSLDFRLFKGAGYALQVPTHLYHFTPASLTRLLQACGWTVEKVLHQRVLGNYLGSIGLWLQDHGAPTSWSRFFMDLPSRRGYLNHALYPLAWPMSWFGQTGRMTVWARRADQAPAERG